jgi:hypothetical protein
VKHLFLALLPVLLLAASPASAADQPAAARPVAAPAAAPRVLAPPRAPVASGQARVAQGNIVPHYGSAWRPDELAALRPKYADLRPRARTNRE